MFAAGIQTFAVAFSGFLIARAAWAPRLTGRWQLNVMLASMAAVPGLAAGLLAAAFGLAAWPALAIGAGVALVAGVTYARQPGRVQALQLRFPLRPYTLDEADRLRTAAQAPDGDPDVPVDNEAMRRLNHARALINVAMREGDHDRVVEALPSLRAVIRDERLDPAVTLLAADDLVSAESLLAQRSGDGARYAAAVELYAQLAGENPGIPAAAATVHETRASYQLFLEQVAGDDAVAAESAGDQAAAARARQRLTAAYRAVNRELAAALDLTEHQDEIRPQRLTMLGSHLCTSLDVVGEDRVDEGIRLCREALALPAGRSQEQRPLSELTLAHCLIVRWEHHGDDRDLDEAEALLKRLVRLGNPVEARAREQLLDIAVHRERGRPEHAP